LPFTAIGDQRGSAGEVGKEGAAAFDLQGKTADHDEKDGDDKTCPAGERKSAYFLKSHAVSGRADKPENKANSHWSAARDQG